MKNSVEAVLLDSADLSRSPKKTKKEITHYPRPTLFQISKTRDNYLLANVISQKLLEQKENDPLGFWKQIKQNTNYINDPEEIMADNITLLILFLLKHEYLDELLKKEQFSFELLQAIQNVFETRDLRPLSTGASDSKDIGQKQFQKRIKMENP